MKTSIDMTGHHFGNVVAIKKVGSCPSGDLKWLFMCGCGNYFEANGYSVRSGRISSCPSCGRNRAAKSSIKHGKSNSPEFRIWTDMHTRCYNQNSTGYKNYGGRGISVCAQWHDFSIFFEDMGCRPSKTHSIERLDVNKGYSPENCVWATRQDQARNKRNNIQITISGETKSLPEWCDVYECSKGAAYERYYRGLRGEAVFKTCFKTVTFNGITDTLSGWALRTGIKANTLAMRLNTYGWTVEKALTKGVER